MFKQIVAKLLANNVLMGIGKIVLVSTVGITTATSAAYVYGNISSTLFSSNEIETDDNSLLTTNQTTQETSIDDTETSTSKIGETNQDSSFNEFVVDIVTSASKIITGTVNGYVSTNQTTDVNTSPSKQNTPITIGVSPLPIEDTNTGSSRTTSVGGNLINVNNDDENEYEKHEDEFEDEDEDENEDEHEEEDEEDEEDED